MESQGVGHGDERPEDAGEQDEGEDDGHPHLDHLWQCELIIITYHKSSVEGERTDSAPEIKNILPQKCFANHNVESRNLFFLGARNKEAVEARASYLISVFADDRDGEPDGHAADCLREEVGEVEEDDVESHRAEDTHVQPVEKWKVLEKCWRAPLALLHFLNKALRYRYRVPRLL